MPNWHYSTRLCLQNFFNIVVCMFDEPFTVVSKPAG
ncbi:hypothetical protein SPACI_002650 [Sporomusa acidovorans DSM 3132]|uniref:Uncharacterized protein n=1 Tax=Sporomusa acidovorans (strain ATCC 49682 / DSM 3132 / Mol) TaxID=1123286 RepID=A0ABZ3IW47_SPOA4|nr:hypothetical protein SPACI_04800 [Sporomusa acidovorans DSM 3132]SDE21487.1 hypothetical protein SAMN04488499_10104 [Sporomusa acidovorans]